MTYQTIYPLSVVPGGIIDNEPDVTARQAWATAGIDTRHLHAGTLPAGDYLVQHRRGDTVGWSTMHLSAQVVLMDGSGRAIRLQCGNSVMPLRQAFIAPPAVDQPPVLVEIPEAPFLFIPTEYAGIVVELPEMPVAADKQPLTGKQPSQYPPQNPGHMIFPGVVVHPHPPAVAHIPEPGGLILAGLLVWAAWRLR